MLLLNCLRSLSLSVLLVICGATIVLAQTTPDSPPADTTMFPHRDDSRWWLSGQLNLISQTHGRFRSPYQGDNSLRPDPEQALSRLWTIYTGVRLPAHTELLFDIESAGGRGLSDALGIAGFTVNTSFAVSDQASADHLFGFVETNGWHNLAGILLGSASLFFALSQRWTREGAASIGLFSLASGVLLLAYGDGGVALWLVPVDSNDAVLLHVLPGVAGIICAAVTPGAAPVARSRPQEAA